MTPVKKLIMISVLATATPAVAQWQPDILGDGYEMRYVDQGTDYSGPVRSTVVRKLSPCGTNRAVLYVHGYCDYFFQKELGDRMVDSCYNFYAVDLRKYGRSLMPGQKPFEVRALSEYFADIDSAMAVMRADGIDDVVLMGHSTGGLITSYYMNETPDSMVSELVLNSPFLDWNMNSIKRNIAIPIVAALGKHAPDKEISNGNSTVYAESLLRDYHGEWDYNTDWKPVSPPKVTQGWIRAIDRAQESLHKKGNIKVPILLMHSDNSVYGNDWNPDFQHGDAILNVDHISRWGKRLGADVTEVEIPGGMHDLILSDEPVRNLAYKTIFDFLEAK